MPYKSESIKISGSLFDRRRKLSQEDREEIRRLYPIVQSQRKLAEMFGVSRRLVTFILNPDKEADNKRLKEEKQRRGNYKLTKKLWAATIREHRLYKQKLYQNRIITISV